MEISGATVRQMETMGNVLLVLTDTHLHIYNKNGKLLREVQHDYANPVIKCSSSRIILYDPSSRVLRIESKTKTIKEMTFDEPDVYKRQILRSYGGCLYAGGYAKGFIPPFTETAFFLF